MKSGVAVKQEGISPGRMVQQKRRRQRTDMKTNYKYIAFNEHFTDSKKTKLFVVVNKSSITGIGCIKWYAPWRQYCFFPNEGTVYSAGCLDDISDFIGSLMAERKQKKETS
jgi:hypothetical protein